MVDLLAAALEWAAEGVPVFPVDAEKRPLTTNGHRDASVMPTAIEAMPWGRAFGVAGRMGAESGLFAIDADIYKPAPAGPAAAEFVKSLKDKGFLPETRVHHTMSGGVHYLFSSDTDWPNCKPSLGVEVKGEGGYIVLPPTPGYTVEHEGVAVAPRGCIELLKAAKASARNSNTIDSLKANILSGEDFHDSLASLAAKLSVSGVSPELVQSQLLATLEASVARNPKHPRHDRWERLITGGGNELSRIVQSGHSKFNPQAPANALREAAAKVGLFAGRAIPGPRFEDHSSEPAAPVTVDPAVYGSDWPFEGGYFGDDTLNVLEQQFIAYPILAENEVTIISAAPKAGKTLVTQTLAMHVAAGSDCGEIKVPVSRPCLYFALEGQSAVRKRMMAWKSSVDPKGTILTRKTFPFYVHERPMNLLKEETRAELAAKIAAADRQLQEQGHAPLGLITFDTLTKATPGGDQNSVEDTSALFDVISKIREHGVTAGIIFVHHDGRNGNTRGSTNIEAEPDTLLGLAKDEKTGYLMLNIRMARSIEDDQAFKFNVVSHTLGTSTQGFEVKAPICVPVTPVEEQAHQAASAMAVSRNTVEVLDSIVEQFGLGFVPLGDAHKHLAANPEVDGKLYPKDKSSRTKTVMDWWIEHIPTTGRICGDYFFMPTLRTDAAGFGANVTRFTGVEIKPAPGVAVPKTKPDITGAFAPRGATN